MGRFKFNFQNDVQLNLRRVWRNSGSDSNVFRILNALSKPLLTRIDTLNDLHNAMFLTRANGVALEAFGIRHALVRATGESDASYRARLLIRYKSRYGNSVAAFAEFISALTAIEITSIHWQKLYSVITVMGGEIGRSSASVNDSLLTYRLFLPAEVLPFADIISEIKQTITNGCLIAEIYIENEQGSVSALPPDSDFGSDLKKYSIY